MTAQVLQFVELSDADRKETGRLGKLAKGDSIEVHIKRGGGGEKALSVLAKWQGELYRNSAGQPSSRALIGESNTAAAERVRGARLIGENARQEPLLVPVDRPLNQVIENDSNRLGDVLIQLAGINPRSELLLLL